MKTSAKQQGLSLVEVTVTIAVAVVLAGTAAPSLLDFIGTRRLEAAATQLASDIQFMRSDAVARNQPVRLSFFNSADGSCYVIHTGAAASCSCAATGPATCTGSALQLKTVQLAARERGHARIDDDEGFEIQHALDFTQRHVQHQPDAGRQ